MQLFTGRQAAARGPDPGIRSDRGAFLFLYFLKTFFTEIYFRFHILQFYTPTARQGAAGTYI